MNTNDSSTKPKDKSERPSFDSDGPWANAWCMHPQSLSSKGDQMQMDSRKSAKPRTFSKRNAASS